ncbi:MAG TPA: SDR family oxidoreductase [Pseudoduganella sp.]|jgi:NAD(P)-dependent dehydrogenase (short-subunit alcohol dehydrogenase family)
MSAAGALAAHSPEGAGHANRAVRADLPRALVVGGCGGMGLACARRMGQRYSVVLADIDLAQAQLHAARLRQEGIAATAIHCDVTRDDSVAAMVAELAAGGALAALVHVVALSPVAGDWRRIMAVNLPGAARVAREVLPLLQRGVGVFVSSIAGHLAGDLRHLHALLDDPLEPGLLDALDAALEGRIDAPRSYMVSKYGLNRLCRRLAPEWGAAGHRIVSLSPGLIATPMGEREFTASPQKYALLDRTPLRRQGGLQEVCDALEFLCSERASFITGTDLLIDGGITGVLSL